MSRNFKSPELSLLALLFPLNLLLFFVFSTTFKDPENQSILDRLVREVKALNSVFLTQHIKGISYYCTKSVVAILLNVDFPFSNVEEGFDQIILHAQ